MENWYLAILDTDKVKDYVFATNDLKEIRGASGLLDNLNLEQMKLELNNGSYGSEGVDWRPIYIAGGGAKLLFKEQERAQCFVCEIEKKYQAFTTISSITGIVYDQPLSQQDLEEF
ncbi:MAG: hypothetical protein ACE5IR_20255, partial [bacterium]